MVKVFNILFMLIAFPGISYVLSENIRPFDVLIRPFGALLGPFNALLGPFDALISAFQTPNDDDSDDSDLAKDQYGNMRKHCSGFDYDSARVMDTYNYTSNLTSYQDLNFAHAQAEAFTLTILYRVMNRSEPYFDIADFPRAYMMKFPPQLPIMCYHAWRALTKNKWQFSRKPLHNVFDMLTYVDAQEQYVKDSKENETLKTPTHAQRYDSYMTQRKTLVDSMKTLETDSTDRASKKLALLNSCSELAKIKSFDIGTDAKDVLSWLSPNFDRKRFNGMAKMFIGDVIMYEILEQACRAAAAPLPAQAKHLDWEKAHELLVKAEQYLKANWNNTEIGQLEKDVQAHIQSNQNTNQAIDKGEFFPEITTYLNDKYHWLAFRAHYYLNSKFETIGACKGTNMRCIKKKGVLVVVRWKDIYSADITIDAVRQEAIVNITEIVRNKKEYPDDRARAEKVTGVVSVGLNGMFDGLHKLTKVKEGVDFDASGKAIKVTSKAMLEVSKTLKTVLKVLTSIGKFLGPFIGSLCAVLSMFEEDGTSAILSKIDEGFNAMQGRFDKIEQGLADLRKRLEEQIEEKTAFHGAFTTYRLEVISPLRQLGDKFQTVGALAQDPFAGKDQQKEQIRLMREACNDKSSNPVTIMSAMYSQMTCASSDPNFCNTVVAWAKENRAKLQGILLSRATELAALVAYNTKCAAYKSESSTIAKIEYETSVVLGQAAEIQRVLSRLENDQLYEWQSTLQITLTAYQNELSADIASAATEIAGVLENKYNWNDFLVIAFDSWNSGGITHNVDGQPQYNFISHFIYNDDNSYVFTHKVQDKDTVYYAIVTWALTNETDSTDYYLKYTENIEGQGSARTTLCGSSFDKHVNYVANGEDVKSMFIFRRHAGHFWHKRHNEYDPVVGQENAADTGFAMEGSLRSRWRHMDCWYKQDSQTFWGEHKDHRNFLYFIANVGGAY